MTRSGASSCRPSSSRRAAAPLRDAASTEEEKEEHVSLTTSLPHRLDRTVAIQASRQTVFRFFTDQTRWATWWGAGSTIDARPGGQLRIRYPDGTEVSGEVIELQVAGTLRIFVRLRERHADSARQLARHDPARAARRRHAAASVARVRRGVGPRRSRARLALSALAVRQRDRRRGQCGRRRIRRRVVRRMVRAERPTPGAGTVRGVGPGGCASGIASR